MRPAAETRRIFAFYNAARLWAQDPAQISKSTPAPHGATARPPASLATGPLASLSPSLLPTRHASRRPFPSEPTPTFGRLQMTGGAEHCGGLGSLPNPCAYLRARPALPSWGPERGRIRAGGRGSPRERDKEAGRKAERRGRLPIPSPSCQEGPALSPQDTSPALLGAGP